MTISDLAIKKNHSYLLIDESATYTEKKEAYESAKNLAIQEIEDNFSEDDFADDDSYYNRLIGEIRASKF